MKFREFLIKRWEYDRWATDQIISSMKGQKVTDEYCLQSLSHLLNVNKIWLDRMRKGSSDMSMNEYMSLEECERLSGIINTGILEFIRSQHPDHLFSKCRYKNTKDKIFDDSYMDMLTQMLNHGEHHRAQVVFQMRSIGAIPPATDYILYIRMH